MSPHKITRREAVKTFIWAAVLSRVSFQTWSGAALHQVAPLASQETATLKLRPADFPALDQPHGAIRLGTSEVAGADPRPLGLYYPVIISRDGEGQFHAVSAECTHAGCVVHPLTLENSTVLHCPCHLSRFALDGAVLQSPATFPLVKYDVRQNPDGDLLIEIPDLYLHVEMTSIQPANGGRLALRFIAFSQIEYEIRHFADLASAESVVPFSLDPEGPFELTSLTGMDDWVDVYLPSSAPRGFYQAAMKIREV